MTKIRVASRIGPVCVSPDDGAALCEAIRAALDAGDGVVLDFEGVRTLTSSFLNTAVGCLYAFYPSDLLGRQVEWVGLDAADAAVVRLVERNAIKFYAADPSDREAMAVASSQVGN